MDYFSAFADINQVALFLKGRLQKPLPGFPGQRKMAPAFRKNYDVNTLKNYREGAVLILLFPQNGKTSIALIERADDGNVHSGQIALPGGKKDDADKSLLDTALRENFEETGIEVPVNSVLGQLTPLYIPPSNFLVTPFVACCLYTPVFRKNDFEVKRILCIPVEDFFMPDIINYTSVHNTGRGIITAPAFEFQGIKIWGATSMILSEFIDVLMAR